MSTTGTERHCRLCLMLNKGGTQACHHLLLKRVKELSPIDHDPYPWTVQQFLDTKKQTIIKSKLSKDKFKILFPNDGDTVLTKWDLSLFCTVLTLYCDLTPPIMRLDVEQLRNLRNELCHMNEPNISVPDYQDKLEIIQVIICRLVQQIDEHNVKTEIENIIKNLESATLSLDETLKEMHAFYMMEMDIREKLDHVEESILQKLEQFDGKWELISKVLGEKEDSRINTAANNGLVPGVNIFLDLKNVNDDEEKNMSDVLQQLFEEVIHEDNDFKSSIPANSYVKLRGAIKKTFDRFLSKGWRITRVKHKCIQLHIECTNFTALAALFREQTQGLIDQQLTELNEALTECVSEKMLLLETTIYTDELWNVIDKAISCVEDVLKEHNIDMANQSDNAQLLGYDIRKHSLSLSAEKVGSDGSGSFEEDCNNKFATFLQLLKAGLKSEFHAPNLLIQANCSTNVIHESNDSSIDNKVELLEEQEHTLTIGSDYQSPKFDKKEKEIIKSFQDEEVEYVERVFKELSLKDIEQQQMETLVKQEEHSSGEKIEITSQVRKDISTAISSASTATDLKEVETEGALHKNALHAILNSVNAISVYIELASLTLIERDRSLLDNIYDVKEDVHSVVWGICMRIADTADIMMREMAYSSAAFQTGLKNVVKRTFEGTEQIIEYNITRLKDIVQDLETRLELKVPTEQMKNQTKAGDNYLHHLQQLCKNEERLLKEWQRDLKDSVLLSKEETKQREEAEDADIKGDKIQFSGTQLVGDKKRIYDDLVTSKMLAQGKIRPSEIHLRHAKDMALKEYDEWQRDLKDSVLLSKEETKQREEAEDVDIKGDKIQFSGTQLVGDKKRIYDDLVTSKMLAQGKIRSSEIHLRHAKDMALKEYDEKTQQTLTEMLRPGPALLVDSTDLKFDEQTLKSHYNILSSDHVFKRDSNIVEDIKAFLSELTSHHETKLIVDPILQGKIEQASSVSLKQPSEDELKRSMSLKLHKEKDREESGPIKVYDANISTSSQLPIKVQDKHIWTASLQLRGGRITFWCIQRIQVHLECITVQLKRINLSQSRVYKSLNYIKHENPRKFLDCPTLPEEWSQVGQLAQDCKKSNDMRKYTDRLFRYQLDYKRVELLRDILKELETKI